MFNVTLPFDVLSDPEERNDVAAANPAIVKAMLARLAELGKSEVTIDESGLCPFVTGTGSTVSREKGERKWLLDALV